MKIIVNHLGFRPGDTSKTAVIEGDCRYEEFTLIDLNSMGYNEIGPNSMENIIAFRGKLVKKETDMGTHHIADFSDFNKTGIYLISLNNEYNSVPFQIREDAYSRTLRKAFDYIHIQRCGQEVPGYHGPCHLDDAVRRDNGVHIDTTGGWHDAGDLRKWTAHTLLLGIGISQLKRNSDPGWKTFNREEGDILNELRWGNAFFLKLIEENGLVWNDVAAGLDGDNSDNRWTDNIIGTEDDRHINTNFNTEVQLEFIYFEALAAGLFKEDRTYSGICFDAAVKALKYMEAQNYNKSKYMAWAILAYKELYLASGDKAYIGKMQKELEKLFVLQECDMRYGQNKLRGYFYQDTDKKEIFNDLRDSGIILISLCEAFSLLDTGSSEAEACLKAIRLYALEYVLPLSEQSPYRIIPYGIYAGTPTDEKYHDLKGELKYRFFAPTKAASADGVAYLGLTSHLLSHAVGLQMAGSLLKDSRLMETAGKQMEWVMGRNPFNSCLMTGEGINNPYPHSRFLGLIPGGIMNGVIGLENDEPYLDMSYGMDWRTTEYWSPHTCFYIWYMSLI